MHEITLYERILESNLINFIIMISVLTLIFKKAKLGDLLDKMARDIKERVETSSQAAQRALQEYKDARHSVKDTPKVKAQIISDAKKTAQSLKEKTQALTAQKKAEIEANLQKILKSYEIKAKSTTIEDIYNACVKLAYSEVKNQLDEQTHKHLIDNSIKELDKLEGLNY